MRDQADLALEEEEEHLMRAITKLHIQRFVIELAFSVPSRALLVVNAVAAIPWAMAIRLAAPCRKRVTANFDRLMTSEKELVSTCYRARCSHHAMHLAGASHRREGVLPGGR